MQSITGSELVEFTVAPEDVAAGEAYRISLTNLSGGVVSGSLRSRFPVDRLAPGFVLQLPSVKDMIETIYRALAVRNPGLGTTMPEAVMALENIEMWLDRARTFMAATGVCSMNDLGRFRLDPMRVLRPGAYVAPLAQPAGLASVSALANYAFQERLSDTVLYYRPNDILHDTAVVEAGEWDIRGQTVVIGKEVRELVIIARSIKYDAKSRITRETRELPSANVFWPERAASGKDGSNPGESGQNGSDGDQDPNPLMNGGADAPTGAPVVNMYVLDATGGLPPIDLGGQDGGPGGLGQDGGFGGNGARGIDADGTWLGGCCRGVGGGGNGGRGGAGGRGGKGGSGGKGGAITLLTSPGSIMALSIAPPSIDVNGGAGGAGGPPGNPGGGGTGAPPGSADCEPWCDDHPEWHGKPGEFGALGVEGRAGDPGPKPLRDAIQILPITEEQWLRELNNPHILQLDPYEVQPEDLVEIKGKNFDPAVDRIYFDGRDAGSVGSTTSAGFEVPEDAEGGYHPVVIKTNHLLSPIASRRISNRAMLHVIPKLDVINEYRWKEGDHITLTGLAFKSGPNLQVLAQDWSVKPPASYALPVGNTTRTTIEVSIPNGPLGSLRGVRRIEVRNPDGGTNRDKWAVRIGDTIVVRCAAFAVVGSKPEFSTTRSAAEIANLFAEGAPNSISIPWKQARIAFRLVQPVQTIQIPDHLSNMWPHGDDDVVEDQRDLALYKNNGGVKGALNFFFFRDVEDSTAYAHIGEGLIFVGDEGSNVLGPVDFQQVVAHEAGHALCLRHVCAKPGDKGPTFFGRDCQPGDQSFLMFPFWNVSDDMSIPPGQIGEARIGATHFEDGKTSLLDPDLSGAANGRHCSSEDTLEV